MVIAILIGVVAYVFFSLILRLYHRRHPRPRSAPPTAAHGKLRLIRRVFPDDPPET
jgi:hypothetical protein